MREKIGLHCEVISGYAFSTSDWKEEGIPVVKIGNISNGEDILCNEQTQYVSEAFLDKLDEKYHISKGDVLISLTGSHINQPNSMVGRTCRNLTDRKYLLNQRAGKILPFDNTNQNYLYYLLSTKAVKYDIANRAYGGANQVNVSPKDIKKIKWEFPDLETQNKIADVLFTYDDLIENNNKRISILEQMAENLYKEWFVNYRFSGYESTPFENDIPVGWEKVTLDSILSKIATGLNPRKNFVLGEGDNYYVTIKNMGDNNIYLDEKCDKVTDDAIRKINNRSDLRQGDLLFSGIGTIGRVYLINIPTDNWNISESVFTMRPNKKVSSEYLYLLLLSNDVQNYCQSNANGAAQKGIRMADLKKYSFWLAPKPILDEFTNVVKPIIEQVDLIRKSNVNLTKQRDLLLPRLMSGKLEVEKCAKK